MSKQDAINALDQFVGHAIALHTGIAFNADGSFGRDGVKNNQITTDTIANNDNVFGKLFLAQTDLFSAII